MLDLIWVKAVLKAIVLPPCGPLLVSLTGLAIVRRYPRTGRLLAALGVLTLLALSLPVVAWLLARNGIIPESATMSRETLPRVEMPARARFVRDNRTGGRDIK